MIVEKYDTSLSLDDQFKAVKHITEDDIRNAYFKVKRNTDTELKLYISPDRKNRTYRFYKGEFKKPDLDMKFTEKRDAYIWLLKTYS